MTVGIGPCQLRALFIAAGAVLALGAAGASSASVAKSARANVYLVASKSFCLASGIDDAYTGDGHVIFYLTLRNSGRSAGKVDIVPVRHYDDGAFNESAMDMLVDVAVPARKTKRFRSPAYKYKAHEHDVAACGVKIDGHREVAIKALHL